MRLFGRTRQRAEPGSCFAPVYETKDRSITRPAAAPLAGPQRGDGPASGAAPRNIQGAKRAKGRQERQEGGKTGKQIWDFRFERARRAVWACGRGGLLVPSWFFFASFAPSLTVFGLLSLVIVKDRREEWSAKERRERRKGGKGKKAGRQGKGFEI
jgi:hypothetical protein